MKTKELDRLRSIKTFPSLVKYLRDELDWPIDSDKVDDLTFDYEPEELGLDAKTAVNIKEIKQLRPLTSKQPWGIFFINFEPKHLPVVVLRRVLRSLVIKKRASANKSHQAAWNLHDLIFISAYGETKERSMTFAHFSEDPDSGELPTLRVLGWDDQDTILHLDHAHSTLKEKLAWPGDEDDLQSWRRQWSEAFSLRHREVITTSKELAIQLAALATRIRNRVNSILAVESGKGSFKQLHQAFKEALIHDLEEDDFADMYAQTITYGLLAARVSRPTGVVTENLAQLVSNPFLKETLDMFLVNGGKEGKVDFDEAGILDVVDLLNSPDTNIEAVLRDFGNRTQREDPVIHFYESFLTEYDKKKKVERGVFYTPQPVVSYIVRSVHELLQTEFGLEDGLASTVTWGEMAKRTLPLPMGEGRPARHSELSEVGGGEGIKIPKGVSPTEPFVQILDPAVGTGTFLVEVIDVVFKAMYVKWEKAGKSQKEIPKLWDDYVEKHLLPRLYGYELMMAPYVIADIKLTLKLTEISRQLGELFYHSEGKGRFNIYLTNSLEPPSLVADEKLADLFLPLAHEAGAVNKIKREKRFTVVVGNPPYSLWSQNLSETARKIVDVYRLVNGEPIKERGALQFEKILQDDYIKFFRLSQVQIDNAGCGILGVITNHAFTDNPTLRGMRDSLLRSFNRVFCLNLHGNSSKKERSPDGSPDENVFDIKQGVAIFHGVQNMITGSELRFCGDLWGTRESKYEVLTKSNRTIMPYGPIEPASPFFLLKQHDTEFAGEYEAGWKITDIFGQGSMGIVTARDHVSIAFDDEPLLRTATTFRDSPLSTKAVCSKLDIPEKKGWDAAKARKAIKQEKSLKSFVKSIDYRPFDTRKIFYHRSLVWGMSWPTMQHVLDKENLGISTTRSIEAGKFQHLFVSKRIIGHHFVSLKEVNYFFPLWIYSDEYSLALRPNRAPNFQPEFLKAVSNKLNINQTKADNLPQGVTPQDIFNYAYAVFNGTGYRSRYAEFLKIDFPRLPLTSSLELFQALGELGGELVALHLMESPKLEKHITKFVGKELEVEKVSYSNKTVWLDKAQTSGFKGVPENVWEFHIGGYQVCHKWLKDRKGRKLSKEDIEHYHRIVVALNETIRLMGEIDEVIDKHGGWPIK